MSHRENTCEDILNKTPFNIPPLSRGDQFFKQNLDDVGRKSITFATSSQIVKLKYLPQKAKLSHYCNSLDFSSTYVIVSQPSLVRRTFNNLCRYLEAN